MMHTYDDRYLDEQEPEERDDDRGEDFDEDSLESDAPAFGGDLAFCSPAFREIFSEEA